MELGPKGLPQAGERPTQAIQGLDGLMSSLSCLMIPAVQHPDPYQSPFTFQQGEQKGIHQRDECQKLQMSFPFPNAHMLDA
jgi:hypothetical protein